MRTDLTVSRYVALTEFCTLQQSRMLDPRPTTDILFHPCHLTPPKKLPLCSPLLATALLPPQDRLHPSSALVVTLRYTTSTSDIHTHMYMGNFVKFDIVIINRRYASFTWISSHYRKQGKECGLKAHTLALIG
jgi:hypothetical protein